MLYCWRIWQRKKGKKKWVRYERSHSLSAVHVDWFFNERYGKWVCSWMMPQE